MTGGGVFEQFVTLAQKAKADWKSLNAKELDDVICSMTRECEKNALYFFDPSFNSVMDGINTIIYTIGSTNDKFMHLESLETTLLRFISCLVKEEVVRVSLRDQYNFLFLMSDFFHPKQNTKHISLFLHIIEAMSRGFVIKWKPTQLKVLMRNVYLYIAENPNPEPSSASDFALALQFLVNVYQKNHSCTLLVRFNTIHKQVMRVFKALWKNESVWGTRILGTHLVYLYEPMLPAETVFSGYDFISKSTEDTIMAYFKATNVDTQVERTSIAFLQLAQFMETFNARNESLFRTTNHTSQVPVEMVEVNAKLICESKEMFLNLGVETLRRLNEFVITMKASSAQNLNHSIGEVILKYALCFIPSYVPVSANAESYKTLLEMSEIFWKDVINGSSLYRTILSVYLYVIQQVLKIGEGMKASFDSLNFHHHFTTLLGKLRLNSNLMPDSVQENILSCRLISCLSCHPSVVEEACEKLNLSLIRELVENLTKSDVKTLANVEWQRSICLIELLNTMWKYSHNTEVLNQLVKFINTTNISKRIATCILNGDEEIVEQALTVVASTSFADTALSSIAKNIVFSRETTGPWEFKKAAIDANLSDTACNGIIQLDYALKHFSQNYERSDETSDVADLINWYKMKEEMHEQELHVVNEQVQHLNKVIQGLRSLMTRQSELMGRKTFQNDLEKFDLLIVQNLQESRRKEYLRTVGALQEEMDLLKEELATKEQKAEVLRASVERSKREKEELEKKFKDEERSKLEMIQKLKTLRDEYRTVKEECTRLKMQLDESGEKVLGLELSLKQKETEAVQNKILFESERRKMDTIRGVIGNYGNQHN